MSQFSTLPVPPTTEDSVKARQAVEVIERDYPTVPPQHLSLCVDHERIEVPRSVFTLIKDILHAMADGLAVSILPCTMKVSTQQAAEFLNVSRAYVCELLETGKLPYEPIGTHRRIMLKDLLALRAEHEKEHRRAMVFLAEQDRELGLEEAEFEKL
jgi:excisionase family DNA binding protein